MKVVLRDDVESVGKKGELVDVADGYAAQLLAPPGSGHRGHRGNGRAGRVDASQPCRAGCP